MFNVHIVPLLEANGDLFPGCLPGLQINISHEKVAAQPVHPTVEAGGESGQGRHVGTVGEIYVRLGVRRP